MTDADKYMENFYNGDPLEWKEEGTEKMWECSKCDGTGREILDFNSNGDPIRDDYCYNCKGTGKLSDEDMERNYQSDQKWKNMASQEDDYIDGSDVPKDGFYESKASELQHDEYEVDVDEYLKTGEPVQKVPKDKRSYNVETSDAEYEDWIQQGIDEDNTRHELDRLEDEQFKDEFEKELKEETIEEAFGDCGCKMTNKAKETWEGLTDSDKQLELREMGVDEGYAYYPFEHLPKKIGEAFVDKFNMEENGDSLGWNKITALERADTLRKIGFTPRDSELVSNLEYQQLSESLKKDVNEALNYKVKAQESQVPQDKSQEAFENGLYSNMYDGYLERRGSRVESKKKQKILENNNYGLNISKVKGVESRAREDWGNPAPEDWKWLDEDSNWHTEWRNDENGLKEIWEKWNAGTGTYHDYNKSSWVNLARLNGYSEYKSNKFWNEINGVESKAKEHNYLGGVPTKIKNTQCPECGSYDSLYEHETHGDLQCEVCGGAFEWEQVAEFNNVEVSDLGESKANEKEDPMHYKRSGGWNILDKDQNNTGSWYAKGDLVNARKEADRIDGYVVDDETGSFVYTSWLKNDIPSWFVIESKANEVRHLSSKQKSLIKNWVEQNKDNLTMFVTQEDLPYELLREIESLEIWTHRDYETLYSDISRYASDVVSGVESKANEYDYYIEDMGIENGDYVDFGSYGELYVVNHGGFVERDTNLWVTDEEGDRFDPNTSGWYIKAGLAKRIIEKGDGSAVESKATERDFYRSNKEISDQGDDIQAEVEFGKKYSELSDSEKGYIEYIKNEFGDVKSYDEWVTSGTEAQVMGTPMTNYDRFGREWGFSIINHGYGEGSETPYEVGIFLHDEIHKKNDVKGWLNEEEALYYKAKFEVDPIDAFRSIGGQMDSIVNPDLVEQTEDNWNLWESLQDSGEASLSDPDNKKYNMDTDFGFSFSDKDIEALDAETDVELSVDNEANQNRDEDGQFTSDLPEEKNEDYGRDPYRGKVDVPFVEAKESKSKAEEAFDKGASAEEIYSLVDDKGTDDDRSESEEEYLNNLYNKTNANKSAGFSDLQ